MGYEIDFLPVGEGERSGDAIALRCGNLSGPRDQQTVIVVDGGFTKDGEALVEHIRQYYGTDVVDVVVSTHPDQDHVSGLKVVLEQMTVGELWMHQPWRHSDDLSNSRQMGFSNKGLADKVTASLQGASDLEEIARERGIPIREPFVGQSTAGDSFIVVGPSVDFYEEQLAAIGQPQSASALIASVLQKAAEAIKGWLHEDHLTETLTDGGTTSPQNNTSAVCLLAVDDHLCLLTADAGMPALEEVAARLEGVGIVAGQLRFVQIPHHGSRKNVGPSVLNRLLGPKGKQEHEAHAFAFVSVAADATHRHPHKKVTNAFTRRGYRVTPTQGTQKWFHGDAPDRPGWTSAEILPLFEQVEDDED